MLLTNRSSRVHFRLFRGTDAMRGCVQPISYSLEMDIAFHLDMGISSLNCTAQMAVISPALSHQHHRHICPNSLIPSTNMLYY